MIAQFGIQICFYLNAISFIPVIVGIAMIRLTQHPNLHESATKNPGVWHEIKEGLRHVIKTPVIFAFMALLAVINIFALNFNVLIPLYARTVFKIGAQGFGFLMAANGIGAVVGSIILAARSGSKPLKTKNILLAASIMCILELMIVPIKTPLLAYFLLALVGFSMIAFTASVNSLIQVQTPDNLRGRVMSIYTLVFVGLSPIGSFLSGSAAHIWGAPASLGWGALISLIFIIILLFRYPTVFKINLSKT